VRTNRDKFAAVSARIFRLEKGLVVAHAGAVVLAQRLAVIILSKNQVVAANQTERSGIQLVTARDHR
jgi:hypothetical protein